MKTVYLDNSATTKTDEEVVKAMLPYLQENYVGSMYKKALELECDYIATGHYAKIDQVKIHYMQYRSSI